jgi:hypothetical protein
VTYRGAVQHDFIAQIIAQFGQQAHSSFLRFQKIWAAHLATEVSQLLLSITDQGHHPAFVPLKQIGRKQKGRELIAMGATQLLVT